MSERIAVRLDTRSYDIHVGRGLIAKAGETIAPFARGVVPVVTDTNIAGLYLEAVLASLNQAGINAAPVVVPAGEETKSFAGLEGLCTSLLHTGVERDGLIVALGGGVVGDLTGFASGILKRGIAFAQIPTTLLSQVDSSVGGKTGIDTAEGKNLIGMFHQPRVVIADVDTLKTLSRRELLAGYAEIAKYGALGDAAFFAWLEQHASAALAGEEVALTSVIAQSCRMKADIVARDERESGERALLNLGHTFGHALESATGYSGRLLHGEAVAIGMVLAFRLSERLGYASASDTKRLKDHLRGVGLPTSIDDIPGSRPPAGELLTHMLHDKKSKDGQLTFVLSRGIGQAFLGRGVPLEAVRELLQS
ncbi:MAG: 3-dehydroquinate synthase [Rhizomicrobium sp.]|jgi:3-dehydroquinate synthase